MYEMVTRRESVELISFKGERRDKTLIESVYNSTLSKVEYQGVSDGKILNDLKNITYTFLNFVKQKYIQRMPLYKTKVFRKILQAVS